MRYIIIITICFTMYCCQDNSIAPNGKEPKSPITNNPDIILSDLTFAKVTFPETPTPGGSYFKFHPCKECVIGDTILLSCMVKNANWNTDDLSGVPIIAKVSTSNGDVENFLLTKNENVVYIEVLPTSLCYTAYIPYIVTNIPDGVTNSIIQIDTKGDVLTAEIKYLNQKLITTLIIKEN